jgi:hypothetical protein
METTTIFWLSLAGCGVLAFFGIVISISQARVNYLKHENQVLGRENTILRILIDVTEKYRNETADQLAQAMKEIKQLSDKVQVRGEDGRFINKN